MELKDALIGEDPVRLRTYNGKLVGPTLRCKPGDTLYITLENKLSAVDPSSSAPHNALREFNTTNLHFHGLHVSPSGISDNVLIDVPPGRPSPISRNPSRSSLRHILVSCAPPWCGGAQLASGMAGAIIIEGGQDELPEIKAANEQTLVLQQIPYVNDSTQGGIGVVEKKFEEQSFRPPAWDTLRRFTTINGQRLPVFTARPGELLRWRIIDGAIRQPVFLRLLKKADASVPGPETLAMHEISVDGIPLGKLRTVSTPLELWPGYRSDVLIPVAAEATPPEGKVVPIIS